MDTSKEDIVWLEDDSIRLGVATGFGPRVVWCSRPDGPNLLAELDDMALEVGDGRRYLLRGGHRLWVGPELPELTYQPDDEPVRVVRTDHAVTVVGRADDFGIVKTIAVSLAPGGGHAIVDHTVKGTATATLDVAPWAITQLRPGGVGVLPLGLPGGPTSPFQAAHQIVVWPYTDAADPALHIGPAEVTVTTDVVSSTKIGSPLLRGWLACVFDELVFVKRARVSSGERFVDLGATGQIYASGDFMELETLGPIGSVAGNTTIHHREVWELHDRPTGDPLGAVAALRLDGATS
jgi:hypothetical protein